MYVDKKQQPVHYQSCEQKSNDCGRYCRLIESTSIASTYGQYIILSITMQIFHMEVIFHKSQHHQQSTWFILSGARAIGLLRGVALCNYE